MKKAVFTLQGPLEGKTMVILDKYSFVDGKMEVSQNDGLLMKAILCNHYGCALEFVKIDGDEVDAEGGEGSLAVADTKPGGITEADKVKAQDLQAKLTMAAAVDKKAE